MKIFNVFARRVFEDNGVKKVKCFKIGYIKETEKGTSYLRLFQQPDTDFFITEKELLPIIDIDR